MERRRVTRYRTANNANNRGGGNQGFERQVSQCHAAVGWRGDGVVDEQERCHYLQLVERRVARRRNLYTTFGPWHFSCLISIAILVHPALYAQSFTIPLVITESVL